MKKTLKALKEKVINIFYVTFFFGIIAGFFLAILYAWMPACLKEDSVLTVKENQFIVNGKLQRDYYIDDNGIKIDIDSVYFKKPIYHNLTEIKDLNAVIYVSDNWKVRPDSIEVFSSSICLQFQNKYQSTSKPSKKARIVFYSGNVPIGETTVKVEIKK